MGVATLAVLMLASNALAEWYFREGPTEFIESDLAGGTGADGRTLLVYCLDGAATVMAYGYPAEAGQNRSESLSIIVSGTEYQVAATRVPPDGIFWGAAPAGLIEALRRGSQAIVMPNGGYRTVVDLSGSSRAIAAALENCAGEGAAATSASLDRAVVEARAQEGCEGTAVLAPEAILETQIDGDGMTDYLLNWESVSCTGGTFAGMRGAGRCGAQNCAVDVFASSVFDPNGLPQRISAVELALTDASDPIALRTRYMSGDCGFADACEREWVWTGSRLEARR